MQSLFPHAKLDWSIDKLEEQVHADPADPELRLQLARALVTRGIYHDGGEKECSRALATARKLLGEDTANAEAMALCGLALVGMQRIEAAKKYLDQAYEAEPGHPVVRLAMGLHELKHGDAAQAVHHLEASCRRAPEAWEPNLALGRALLTLSRRPGAPPRLLERAQFHLVRALRADPPHDQVPALQKDLGLSCMLSGRHREAERFFVRLREHPEYAPVARFHLGQVAYSLGKYHNAIQHYRQFLHERPDDAAVLARMAMAWFQLGELRKAREACHKALAADPGSVPARHALGCTQLEEGDPNEAMRTFRELLKEHPEHTPTYVELVRARRMGGDEGWLKNALEQEVNTFDRLPPGRSSRGRAGGEIDPRTLTRERIGIVLEELRSVGPGGASTALRAIHLTQDEALRFQLWEAACGMATGAVADATAGRLRMPGRFFGPELGGEALAAAGGLPDPVLTGGLRLEEADLKKAAVDRWPAAHDVQAHRKNLEAERQKARAYQALLLLSVASRRSPAGRSLLQQWAAASDPELAAAAWAGLALYGDPQGAQELRTLAQARGAGQIVDRLLARVSPPEIKQRPHRVADTEHTSCTTCGRGTEEVTYMMAGGSAVICDTCVHEVSRNRRTLLAPDDATCSLCRATPFEVNAVYRLQGTDICSNCLQLALGMLEREDVDRFLATW